MKRMYNLQDDIEPCNEYGFQNIIEYRNHISGHCCLMEQTNWKETLLKKYISITSLYTSKIIT